MSGMARRPRVAINTGGSIVAPEHIDKMFLSQLADVLSHYANARDLLVVVGGGHTARRYIEACRELGADETYLDLVGIDATRMNARLLISALQEGVYEGVPITLDEAMEAADSNGIVVMGGTHPGQTTDAVSAMLAERSGAEEMLVLTNVDGVYTADPRKDPDAMRLPEITTGRLLEIVSGGAYKAGSNTVVDPVAAGIIHRAAIPTKVLDGRNLTQVTAALEGEDFVGTVVTPGD
ncbi:MAG: UMP kinase [Thermoplasmata archaeon]|nr:MAG: UMP kinase [Thermoplasmata archaeon]